MGATCGMRPVSACWLAVSTHAPVMGATMAGVTKIEVMTLFQPTRP